MNDVQIFSWENIFLYGREVPVGVWTRELFHTNAEMLVQLERETLTRFGNKLRTSRSS